MVREALVVLDACGFVDFFFCGEKGLKAGNGAVLSAARDVDASKVVEVDIDLPRGGVVGVFFALD